LETRVVPEYCANHDEQKLAQNDHLDPKVTRRFVGVVQLGVGLPELVIGVFRVRVPAPSRPQELILFDDFAVACEQVPDSSREADAVEEKHSEGGANQSGLHAANRVALFVRQRDHVKVTRRWHGGLAIEYINRRAGDDEIQKIY
jgi:hypothetical protein